MIHSAGRAAVANNLSRCSHGSSFGKTKRNEWHLSVFVAQVGQLREENAPHSVGAFSGRQNTNREGEMFVSLLLVGKMDVLFV